MMALIQIGDSTHHHDQAITFVNLSTMNTIVSSPTKPIPPDDELLFDDIISSPFLLLGRGQYRAAIV